MYEKPKILQINELTILETLMLLHKVQKGEVKEPEKKIKTNSEFWRYNTRCLGHINDDTTGCKEAFISRSTREI